jgi:hypothetical protein
LLKKTITYEDFNEEMVSEDYYFHLSKAELIELEMGHEGGLAASLQRIVDAKDGKGIIEEFKNIILSAYGKKSDDGRRFIKNQTLRDEFESSEAYSTLFVELVTNTDAAIEFINGVIPKGMAEEAERIARLENNTSSEEPKDLHLVPEDKPQTPEQKEIITRKQLVEMGPEQFNETQIRISSGEVTLVE